MQNHTKLIWIITLILVIAGIIYLIYPQGITARVIESSYTYTKAICNDSNFCQDYEVSCLNGEIISAQPITGAVIQHSSNWKDPRENKSEITCE